MLGSSYSSDRRQFLDARTADVSAAHVVTVDRSSEDTSSSTFTFGPQHDDDSVEVAGLTTSAAKKRQLRLQKTPRMKMVAEERDTDFSAARVSDSQSNSSTTPTPIVGRHSAPRQFRGRGFRPSSGQQSSYSYSTIPPPQSRSSAVTVKQGSGNGSRAFAGSSAMTARQSRARMSPKKTESEFETVREFQPGFYDHSLKNHVLCSGRLIAGPQRRKLIQTFLVILIPVILFLSKPCKGLEKRIAERKDAFPGEEYAPAIVTILLVSVTLALMFATGLMDPGIIPRIQDHEVDDSLLQNPIKVKRPALQNITVGGHCVQLKFCRSCEVFRPPRSSHCRDCNNCVERWDHHCPWVGNCVAKRNYPHFIGFLVTLNALVIWTMAWLCYLLQLGTRESQRQNGWNRFKESTRRHPVAVLLLVFEVVVFWFPLALLIFHFYIIATNQTTYEQQKAMFDFVSPYNRGWLKNFLAMFCRVRLQPSNVHLHHAPPLLKRNEAEIAKRKVVYVTGAQLTERFDFSTVSMTNSNAKKTAAQLTPTPISSMRGSSERTLSPLRLAAISPVNSRGAIEMVEMVGGVVMDGSIAMTPVLSPGTGRPMVLVMDSANERDDSHTAILATAAQSAEFVVEDFSDEKHTEAVPLKEVGTISVRRNVESPGGGRQVDYSTIATVSPVRIPASWQRGSDSVARRQTAQQLPTIRRGTDDSKAESATEGTASVTASQRRVMRTDSGEKLILSRTGAVPQFSAQRERGKSLMEMYSPKRDSHQRVDSFGSGPLPTTSRRSGAPAAGHSPTHGLVTAAPAYVVSLTRVPVAGGESQDVLVLSDAGVVDTHRLAIHGVRGGGRKQQLATGPLATPPLRTTVRRNVRTGDGRQLMIDRPVAEEYYTDSGLVIPTLPLGVGKGMRRQRSDERKSSVTRPSTASALRSSEHADASRRKRKKRRTELKPAAEGSGMFDYSLPLAGTTQVTDSDSSSTSTSGSRGTPPASVPRTSYSKRQKFTVAKGKRKKRHSSVSKDGRAAAARRSAKTKPKASGRREGDDEWERGRVRSRKSKKRRGASRSRSQSESGRRRKKQRRSGRHSRAHRRDEESDSELLRGGSGRKSPHWSHSSDSVAGDYFSDSLSVETAFAFSGPRVEHRRADKGERRSRRKRRQRTRHKAKTDKLQSSKSQKTGAKRRGKKGESGDGRRRKRRTRATRTVRTASPKSTESRDSGDAKQRRFEAKRAMAAETTERSLPRESRRAPRLAVAQPLVVSTSSLRSRSTGRVRSSRKRHV